MLNLPWEAEKSEENMMKKTMMAVAALSAAVAFASDIVSSDIVGYMSKDVNYKNNLGASPFLQIGLGEGEGFKLENIKPTFDTDWESGDLQAKTLKANGKINETYFYLTDADAAEIDGGTAGWFNEDMDTRISGDDELVFNEGEGFILYTELQEAGDVSVTYSGAVATDKITYQVGYKNNMQGNVTPVTLQLKDIVVGDVLDKDNNPTISGSYESGDIQAKTWKANGKIDETYFYLTAADAAEIDEGPAGWFNEDMDTRMAGDDKVEFAAGDGFVIYTELSDGAYVQIPSAL
jgi:hypothetical protein